jgi:hypothetical protein
LDEQDDHRDVDDEARDDEADRCAAGNCERHELIVQDAAREVSQEQLFETSSSRSRDGSGSVVTVRHH